MGKDVIRQIRIDASVAEKLLKLATEDRRSQVSEVVFLIEQETIRRNGAVRNKTPDTATFSE